MNKTLSMYLYMKLNWDANRFLPTESKDCTCMNYKADAVSKKGWALENRFNYTSGVTVVTPTNQP